MSTKKPTANTAKTTRAASASPVSQPIVRATLALAGVTIVAAMILSYSAQAALAERCGLNYISAWLFPVVVDVPLVASTLAATAMRNYTLRARAFPMLTLLGYVGISVWLNAEHAATLGTPIPTGLRVTILSIPALTLAVVVELALVVSRRSEPRAIKPARTIEVPPAVAVQTRTDAPSTGAIRNGATAKRTYTDSDRAEWDRLSSEGLSGRKIALATGASSSAVQMYLASKGAVGAVA